MYPAEADPGLFLEGGEKGALPSENMNY